MTEDDRRISYPFFFSSEDGEFSPLLTFDSPILNREHRARVLLPPGYHENTMSCYPVIFFQDGQNLFFPEEAFEGHDWGVDATNLLLRSMCAVEDIILVGLYSGAERRMEEFTKPGYERYARSLVQEVVPKVNRRLRVL